jgi:hypothetical protein
MTKRTTSRSRDFVPAMFMGLPVALVLPGMLMGVMALPVALVVGAVVGMSVGLLVLSTLRRA